MTGRQSKFSEISENGGVLLACFAGMMFGVAAIPFYTLGVFAGPVTDATGWTMQQYQTAFTFIIAGTLFGPVFGHFCDRFGARPVAILSTIAFALSLASLGFAAGLGLYVFYAAWAIMAIVGQGTGPVIWTHVIGHNFGKNRGLAFGIVLAGSGVFAAVGPTLVSRLIALWGVNAAYAALGAIVMLVAFPLVAIFLRVANQQSVSPEPDQGPFDLEGLTLKAALRNYRFYLIAASFFIIAFGVAGLISNMIPILRTSGLSLQEASQLIGLIGVSVIGGRLIIGAMLDRFWAPTVAVFALICPAIACLLLLDDVNSWNAAIAILLVGFAAGAEFDIVAFLATKYFGLKAYGKIYGLLYIALFVGAAFAPPIFGMVLDKQGSYRSVLLVFSVAIPVAALSLLALGAYPRVEGSSEH